MECFSSQLEEQAYDQHIHALNIFRTYTLPKTIQAAEGFERYTHTELKNYEIRFLNSEYQKQYRKQLLPLLPQPPKISVLIRSLNRSTLSTALDSLAAQTYSNIEMILINDGSTDRTEEIVREFQNEFSKRGKVGRAHV